MKFRKYLIFISYVALILTIYTLIFLYKNHRIYKQLPKLDTSFWKGSYADTTLHLSYFGNMNYDTIKIDTVFYYYSPYYNTVIIRKHVDVRIGYDDEIVLVQMSQYYYYSEKWCVNFQINRGDSNLYNDYFSYFAKGEYGYGNDYKIHRDSAFKIFKNIVNEYQITY